MAAAAPPVTVTTRSALSGRREPEYPHVRRAGDDRGKSRYADCHGREPLSSGAEPPAAVDVQDLPGDVTGLRGGEVGDRGGDVTGLTEPPGRDLGDGVSPGFPDSRRDRWCGVAFSKNR